MLPPPLPPDAALFLDVDGTLLDIAPRPELVHVPPTLPDMLEHLAASRGGALALVSGRRIDDLDALLRPWRGAAAGMHGAERRLPDGRRVAAGQGPADHAATAALNRLRPVLHQIVQQANAPGLLLEDKGETLALHYRLAPQAGHRVAPLITRMAEAESDSLRLIAGKMVFELQPRHYGKNGAIAAFMAEPPFRGRVPVFVGDDTTDEDGFAEINRRGGVSVRVGQPNPATAARYALASVAAVHSWLSAGVPR